MKYSIDLESPFTLSAHWYAVGALLLILAVALWYLTGRLHSAKIQIPFLLPILRWVSLRRIGRIERAFERKELDSRAVHQKMSAEVRGFVQAATGLPTQTMVYEELRRLQKPELAALIGEYYEPEFAYSSEADAGTSIEKGKELIKKWV